MSDNDKPEVIKIGADGDPSDPADPAYNLKVQLAGLIEDFTKFQSLDVPTRGTISDTTKDTYRRFNELHKLVGLFVDLFGDFVTLSSEKIEEASAAAEKNEALLKKLSALDAERTELGKQLADAFPFHLTFAYVATVISTMIERGTSAKSGSDPLRRIETRDTIKAASLTAENRHAQICLADEDGRRLLKIRRRNPSTGKPVTNWVPVEIKIAEALNTEQLLLIAGILELPHDSLPHDTLAGLQLPSDPLKKSSYLRPDHGPQSHGWPQDLDPGAV